MVDSNSGGGRREESSQRCFGDQCSPQASPAVVLNVNLQAKGTEEMCKVLERERETRIGQFACVLDVQIRILFLTT